MNVPNSRLLNAFQESEDIINGKVAAKRYNSFEELIEDIDEV